VAAGSLPVPATVLNPVLSLFGGAVARPLAAGSGGRLYYCFIGKAQKIVAPGAESDKPFGDRTWTGTGLRNSWNPGGSKRDSDVSGNLGPVSSYFTPGGVILVLLKPADPLCRRGKLHE